MKLKKANESFLYSIPLIGGVISIFFLLLEGLKFASDVTEKEQAKVYEVTYESRHGARFTRTERGSGIAGTGVGIVVLAIFFVSIEIIIKAFEYLVGSVFVFVMPVFLMGFLTYFSGRIFSDYVESLPETENQYSWHFFAAMLASAVFAAFLPQLIDIKPTDGGIGTSGGLDYLLFFLPILTIFFACALFIPLSINFTLVSGFYASRYKHNGWSAVLLSKMNIVLLVCLIISAILYTQHSDINEPLDAILADYFEDFFESSGINDFLVLQFEQNKDLNVLVMALTMSIPLYFTGYFIRKYCINRYAASPRLGALKCTLALLFSLPLIALLPSFIAMPEFLAEFTDEMGFDKAIMNAFLDRSTSPYTYNYSPAIYVYFVSCLALPLLLFVLRVSFTSYLPSRTKMLSITYYTSTVAVYGVALLLAIQVAEMEPKRIVKNSELRAKGMVELTVYVRDRLGKVNDPKIQIMNIGPAYHDEILLKQGRYRIRVSSADHITKEEEILLLTTGIEKIEIFLERKNNP